MLNFTEVNLSIFFMLRDFGGLGIFIFFSWWVGGFCADFFFFFF